MKPKNRDEWLMAKSRIDWLQTLAVDYETQKMQLAEAGIEDPDPSATNEMLAEVRSIHKELINSLGDYPNDDEPLAKALREWLSVRKEQADARIRENIAFINVKHLAERIVSLEHRGGTFVIDGKVFMVTPKEITYRETDPLSTPPATEPKYPYENVPF